MARKKIVFVIVEGPSDDTALGVLLSKIYDKDTVYVHIWRGDITSDNKVNASNIISKIGNAVKSYARSQHFTNKHFAEIIHIVDMDGAYIPNDHILKDENLEKNVYGLTMIKTVDPDAIIQRNERKRSNINKLCGCKEIWSIPYRVYYMSSNLDHVLYGKLNSTDEEKENDAYQFAKKYSKNIEGFLKYIIESDFSVMGEYKESWDFIKQGLHSLERYTNLGIELGKINERVSEVK